MDFFILHKYKILGIVVGIILLLLFSYFLYSKYNYIGEELVVNEREVSSVEEKEIKVYIGGAVYKGGDYLIDSNKGMEDLILLAGGLRDSADTIKIDYKKKLKDGLKIKIPFKEDIIVSLNKGCLEEFLTLPGVGESRAKLIIEYREEHGFNNIEDLMNIKGIGQVSFEKIKSFITL